MQGRDHFSCDAAEVIKSTLRRVRKSLREKQTRLRDTLREDLHFYITDFDASRRGFTAESFDELVKSGRITVGPE